MIKTILNILTILFKFSHFIYTGFVIKEKKKAIKMEMFQMMEK